MNITIEVKFIPVKRMVRTFRMCRAVECLPQIISISQHFSQKMIIDGLDDQRISKTIAMFQNILFIGVVESVQSFIGGRGRGRGGHNGQRGG